MPLPIVATLLVFVLSCCVFDVRTRRIPNAISAPAILIGLILNGLYFGSAGLLASAGGVVVMIAVLIAPFALGGIGAGDVKMMAAVGAFLGPRLAILGLALGMGVGGIVMAVHLVRLGRLTEKVGALQAMISSAVVTRSTAPLRVAADDPGAISLPYSVPLGLGTAAAILAAAALRV
jgi:prepilin peptidase CpaA